MIQFSRAAFLYRVSGLYFLLLILQTIQVKQHKYMKTTQVHDLHTYIMDRIYACIHHEYNSCFDNYLLNFKIIHVCMMYVYVHAYVCTSVCMNVDWNVCSETICNECVCVCVCVCVYTSIHVQICL